MVEIVAPLDINRLSAAFKKFQQFKERLLTSEDSVDIQGRRFLKKSAWRKWALACGVSDRILSIERNPDTGRDPENGFYYRVLAEAFHLPTGRSVTGAAIASSKEKKAWAHEEHDIFALACTRAKNRAISDLVGGGEVSAEEVQADAEGGTWPSQPQKPAK
jgi:hypothetical protein